MKTLTYCFFTVFFIIISSCSEDEPVTTPAPPPPKRISMNGYGAVIESAYYKIWSDSSWEKFNRLIKVGNITYVTLIDNEWNEFYYNEEGYAGVKLNGEPLILFDSIPEPLPETLTVNQVYFRKTSYTFKGTKYITGTESILLDTITLSLPFGSFSSCVWFKLKSAVIVNGYKNEASSQQWIAKGPSTIRYETNVGRRVTMARGRVNFQGWGMTYPNTISNLTTESISKHCGVISKHFQELNKIERTLLIQLQTMNN